MTVSASGAESGAARQRGQSDPVVEVVELRRRFSDVVALDGVSFQVARGGVVGLLGPNGAGKTTCLRVLCGYIVPSSGSARIDGVDLASDSLGARRRIGYLAEGTPLYDDLRVREYLAFRSRLKRVPRKERGGEIARVAELCALTDVLRRRIGVLSRGYRQRVGLADALLGGPPLIVLDEPTAGLDPHQIVEMRGVLRQLAGAQTVLLSSHILSEVEATCDEVLILDRGKLVASGPVAEVCGPSSGLELVLRGDPQEIRDRLASLDGIDRVELSVDGGQEGLCRVALHGEIDGAARERIVREAVAHGWGVRQMRPARRGLEELFVRLTRRSESG